MVQNGQKLPKKQLSLKRSKYQTMNNDLLIKLRAATGMGVIDIKRALEEADGDESKALALLKERGEAVMAKKQERTAAQGVVESYTHAGRIGVMVEVNCETDFVARNPDFATFAHDVALQISSMAPTNTDELLAQDFIKDSSKTVGALLTEMTAKMGEKLVIGRFMRWELGEQSADSSKSEDEECDGCDCGNC